MAVDANDPKKIYVRVPLEGTLPGFSPKRQVRSLDFRQRREGVVCLEKGFPKVFIIRGSWERVWWADRLKLADSTWVPPPVRLWHEQESRKWLDSHCRRVADDTLCCSSSSLATALPIWLRKKFAEKMRRAMRNASTSDMDSTKLVVYIFVAAITVVTAIGVLVAYFHY